MLLEFTVGNFLSFKDKKTLSLVPAKITELPDNVLSSGEGKVLNGAVIYGANSSGKSNFIKAIDFMRKTILTSSKLNSVDPLNVTPFLLSTETEDKPSYFELLFLENGTRIRYGFEIDDHQVHSEWLYCQNENLEEEPLFVREQGGIAVSDKFEQQYHAKEFIERTNDNALFLAVCDTWGVALAKEYMKYFSKIKILSGIKHEKDYMMTIAILRDSSSCEKVKELLRKLQLGFSNICGYDDDMFFEYKVRTIHNKYDKNGEIVGQHEFKMLTNESAGTNKIFDIIGYIFCGLEFGLPVIIDELDAKLHPLLTIEIIRMFNSKESNPKGGQLIFATHDTNLLSSKLFRRDQIWFTEKDNMEATDLYSLVEFKGDDNRTVRKDRSFEADYIKGRYGAIPYIR